MNWFRFKFYWSHLIMPMSVLSQDRIHLSHGPLPWPLFKYFYFFSHSVNSLRRQRRRTHSLFEHPGLRCLWAIYWRDGRVNDSRWMNEWENVAKGGVWENLGQEKWEEGSRFHYLSPHTGGARENLEGNVLSNTFSFSRQANWFPSRQVTGPVFPGRCVGTRARCPASQEFFTSPSFPAPCLRRE